MIHELYESYYMNHVLDINYSVLAMAVGFSLKQGTKEIRKVADDFQLCLSELLGPHNHKLIFMMIPRQLRQFIPLKYWPCK